MTIALTVALAAGVVALAAALVALRAAQRTRALSASLDAEIERGKAEFDAVVARESEQRAAELANALARARAESLSALAEEERRVAEERRRDVVERERDATARLGQALVDAQRRVEQRLADWSSDLEKLQQGLADEVTRIAARQRQLMAEVEARIGTDAEGLEATLEEQRNVVARMREDLERTAQEILEAASSDLEQHAAERRRALHEVAERLRQRERALREQIDREQTEATQRIQAMLSDVEHRQVEQLKRVVSRAATRYAEAASQQFDGTIRTAREEAARRLGRELDVAVERFAHEAHGVLAERVTHVTNSAAQQVERRLSQLRTSFDRQRDEAMASLEQRAQEVEGALRVRLQEIAGEAEAERAVLDARLHELARRLDELAARA